MKLGIIGVGIVGGTLKRWLEKNTSHQVLCKDKRGLDDDFEGVSSIFIALPVPTHSGDNRQELGDLEGWVEWCAARHGGVPIFIKSTVLPGTCDRLSKQYSAAVYAMPEFLTERTCDLDFDMHPILVGGLYPSGDKLVFQMAALLSETFSGKAIIPVTNIEAEIAKYAHNCFGAMKVNYFNTIYELCTRLGANYDRVKDGVMLSGLIERTHTHVPGPDGKFGFGGKCFPKDLSAFSRFLLQLPVTGGATLANVEADNFYFRYKRSS